jgi:N-acetylated-alpha-linked acidic dipeptidase
MLQRIRAFVLPVAVATTLFPAPAVEPADIRGFTAASAKIEREWEAKFRAIPEPSRMRESMRRLSARPHHVGSPYGKMNAEWLRDQFKSYGWDANIEEYSVLFPTPKERLVEMVAPTKFVARLDEPVLKEDPTSNQKSEQLPTYVAYSADGDVTGPLVYVNYGVPADYDELEKRGISVKGAIVIARYGGSWRGIKPKVAQEHGAIGCLIYSDPRDDGYSQGDVYPNGPWRPKDGAQRGSIMDMPVAPGDPLTVGVGATTDARRIDRKDAATVMKIPVLPLSYADAQPLLAAMTGPVAPESWRGSLPITYHLGAGSTRVHLKVNFDWTLKPLYDVIAKLPGAVYPDEWVIRGNHHDAWVNGAEDPISGAVPELEEARALGELVKQGWRPKRTLVYTMWDGEEPALLGSTEWAETHGAELQRKAVAYFNTDGNGRGYLGVGGSHSLERFTNQVAKEIIDPETKLTVWARQQAGVIRNGSTKARAEARTRGDLRIEALGSGSDFTPFLQHLGIPTLNAGYGGEDGGGIYHSVYDSFNWYTKYSDTSFVYGRALAQTIGTMVMRMANADVLPFEFGGLAETVKTYVGELKELREGLAGRIAETNQQLADGVFAATTDPRDPIKSPAPEPNAPVLNFAAMDNASDSLSRAAVRYEKAYASAMTGGATSAAMAEANAILRGADQALLAKDGLPKRPWYQHLLYAPGLYTGYGVKTMPAAREAIEQKAWKDADVEIGRVAAALAREAELVHRAASTLEGKPVVPVP